MGELETNHHVPSGVDTRANRGRGLSQTARRRLQSGVSARFWDKPRTLVPLAECRNRRTANAGRKRYRQSASFFQSAGKPMPLRTNGSAD